MATSPSSTGHHVPAVASRSERVAQRSTAHGFLGNAIIFLKTKRRGKFLVLMFLTAIILGCVVKAWNQPFRFRMNSVANRAIICNTAFSVISPEQTDIERTRVRSIAPHVFSNDSEPLVQLRESLWNTLTVLTSANTYNELGESEQLLWLKFLRYSGSEDSPSDSDIEDAFDGFIALFKSEVDSENLEATLSRIFEPFETRGVLKKMPFELGRGSQDRVLVYLKRDSPDMTIEYRVSDVLLRDGIIWKNAVNQEFQSPLLREQLFNWIYSQLPETLHEDKNATAKVVEESAMQVEDVVVEYTRGQLLVSADSLLKQSDINLLFAEYQESQRHRTKTERFLRFVSVSGIFFLTLVIMIALVFRVERRRPYTSPAFSFLMIGVITTAAAAQCVHWSIFTSADWEIMPLTLFVMLVSIVYSWELAVIFSFYLTIVIVFGNGGNVELFLTLLGTSAATAVQLGRIRSRKKLVIVGVLAGVTALILTIALGILGNRMLDSLLITDAVINFAWVVLAGLLMTGLLPFIEKRFGILTDMSLLELGDVSHPLIQELIKVAPATYGHSMQVGAIAETAVDAVGARALLTRMGAYFHDIGKIMKPEYFSENQGGLDNIHDTIEPQLSTIVLIAHVKDGVDMARQYGLPKPLVDLIEQHHGTSLVSFFYGRATKGGKEEVEESTFRYPGPKPQSKEAAILMIADTCESACRSMGTGVPPNKVEAKIRSLIKQKLDDGQFDDSGLTLNELKIVEKSVVNSVVAAMHGRIQYPEGAEKIDHHREFHREHTA
ncbi:MAG: HDIG domain-containing protein [Planctomycetaceae bacterium]|jgi:putative nucleotidyltransferase with HDIG domain|nr:HDIG domain-containing protein [Planctomycetaceae bacterium]